jgi:cytoplasmic iron level regulating protein YaaA (DUF328/UPF0246 family)
MKNNLIAVISPAKLLDDKTHHPEIKCTQPALLGDAELLADKLKKLSGKQLSGLMDLSTALGDENKRRYAEWHLPFTHKNAHPAILMFKGDVYRGMKAENFSKKELDFAQDHLRILSGLYGLLRPLDLVMAYRLMMGTPFAFTPKIRNLYLFWGNKIAAELAKELEPKGTIVNLASTEYFKAVDLKTLNRKVITCEFKEKKGDKYVVVMTYAKLARGMMARFLIEHSITKVQDLKAFDSERYLFNEKISTADNWIFTRG